MIRWTSGNCSDEIDDTTFQKGMHMPDDEEKSKAAKEWVFHTEGNPFRLNCFGFLQDLPEHLRPVDMDTHSVAPDFNETANGQLSDEAQRYDMDLENGCVPDGNYIVLPTYVCPLVEQALDARHVPFQIYSADGAEYRYELDASVSSFQTTEVPYRNVPINVLVVPKASGITNYEMLWIAEQEWKLYVQHKKAASNLRTSG